MATMGAAVSGCVADRRAARLPRLRGRPDRPPTTTIHRKLGNCPCWIAVSPSRVAGSRGSLVLPVRGRIPSLSLIRRPPPAVAPAMSPLTTTCGAVHGRALTSELPALDRVGHNSSARNSRARPLKNKSTTARRVAVSRHHPRSDTLISERRSTRARRKQAQVRCIHGCRAGGGRTPVRAIQATPSTL